MSAVEWSVLGMAVKSARPVTNATGLHVYPEWRTHPPMLQSSRLDQLGVIASSVCVLHCALGSLMIGATGLTGPVMQDERLETMLLLCAVVVASIACTIGYRRHQDRSVVSLMVAGLFFAAIGRIFEPSAIPEPVFPILAAVFLIGAHTRNALLLRRLRTCCDTAVPSCHA